MSRKATNEYIGARRRAYADSLPSSSLDIEMHPSLTQTSEADSTIITLLIVICRREDRYRPNVLHVLHVLHGYLNFPMMSLFVV